MQNETYDPLSIESKWQEKWEQGKKFQPIESDKKFSIVIRYRPCRNYYSAFSRKRS